MNIFFVFLISLTSAFMSHPHVLSAGKGNLRCAGRLMPMTELRSHLTGGEDDDKSLPKKGKEMHQVKRRKQEGRQRKLASCDLDKESQPKLRSLNVNMFQNQREKFIFKEMHAEGNQDEPSALFESGGGECDAVLLESKQGPFLGSFAASKQQGTELGDPTLPESQAVCRQGCRPHESGWSSKSVLLARANLEGQDALDPAAPIAAPEHVRPRVAVGRRQSIGGVAAQHPYYGYWSSHAFQEPGRVGQAWCVGCPLCPVVSSSPCRSACVKNLNRHVKTVHDKVRDFKCPWCPYAAGQKTTLQQHLLARHLLHHLASAPRSPKK